MQLQKCTVVQLKVQWKHFEVDEATWENEATMRKAYPTLFHDIIQSLENTMDSVVLCWEGCNILNFGPTIYRHEPIDHDDYTDVLFYIGSKTPQHMNMNIVLYIGRKPIFDDIYVYICWFCWAWTLKHMIDEMFCVE